MHVHISCWSNYRFLCLELSIQSFFCTGSISHSTTVKRACNLGGLFAASAAVAPVSNCSILKFQTCILVRVLFKSMSFYNWILRWWELLLLVNLSNDINLKNSAKCLGLFVCIIYRTFHLCQFGSSIPPYVLALVSGKQANPMSSDIAAAAFTDWGRSASAMVISHPSKVCPLGVEFCACFPKCVLCTPLRILSQNVWSWTLELLWVDSELQGGGRNNAVIGTYVVRTSGRKSDTVPNTLAFVSGKHVNPWSSDTEPSRPT